MTRRSALLLLALPGVLAGCAMAKGPLQVAATQPVPDWHEVATDTDQQRLRAWRDAWMKANDAVRQAGQGAALDQQADLFNPDRALADPVPPPGDYRCRWIKLGSAAPNVAAYTAYPPVACRISTAGKLERLRVLEGPQRPKGLIFPDEQARGVFLGTLQLGDEQRALDYASDRQRDMAGYVERIGDGRWRLVLPQPHFESMFDLIEITAAP
ncbi:MAG: DUF4893 domain-containing protein [Sphingomonas sp.]